MVIKFISNLIHKIRHVFGWYDVNIITWRTNDVVHIGVECTECGYIDPKSIATMKVKHNDDEHPDLET